MFQPNVKLTPPKSKYGFDIIADIGKLRFLRHNQIDEIFDSFKNRNVHIPKRSIENLCHTFLLYLVAVHLESLPKLTMLIENQGGYVIHIDTTNTKGNPQLLMIKDNWSGIRLIAASIPTEAADYVKPHLEMLQKQLRNPVAAIRDMGEGIENALNEVFSGVFIITCHYHFLRAVGQRLFNSMYFKFQRRVDRTGIKKNLRKLQKQFKKRKVTEERDDALSFLKYVFAYKKDGNGLGYPFSLPATDFYRRCEEVRPKVHKMILVRAKDNVSSPCLSQLENTLNLLNPPPAIRGRIHSEFIKLDRRWNWFETIRKALRYRNGLIPLNTKGFLSNKELESGRKMVDKLQKDIDEFVKQGDCGKDRYLKRTLRGISELIAERKDELFVPNVVVNINGNKRVKKLPRTNNPIEQDFRSLRRHGRRIRGDGDVERIVQRDGPGLAIVKNLELRDYVRSVYGRPDRMALRFANVSSESLEMARALFYVEKG